MDKKNLSVVLFGAGQIGAMVSRLMGTGYTVLCFADNSEVKWGTRLLGIPIQSLKDSLALKPDCFCLCVLDGERSSAMEQQLRTEGYTGSVLRPNDLKIFDARVATMRLLSEQIYDENIPGDVAELGVYRGDFAALINTAFPDRMLHLFDTFEGFSEKDVALENSLSLSHARVGDFADTSIGLVRENLPYPDLAKLYAGYFPHTFQPCMDKTFAFVSIDADLYAPTAAALPLFWDRLSKGGVLLIHDVNSTQFSGAGKAVREFCKERGILPMPVCDLHGSVVLRRQ